MTIKAVLHRIVVKPFELEKYDPVRAKAKELGIEIPDVEENKYHHTQVDQGTVEDVGPTAFLDYVKKHDKDIPVKVGDVVTYARHSGKTVTDPFDPKLERIVLNDEDVIAVHPKE